MFFCYDSFLLCYDILVSPCLPIHPHEITISGSGSEAVGSILTSLDALGVVAFVALLLGRLVPIFAMRRATW